MDSRLQENYYNSDFDPLFHHTGWDTLHTREQVHVHSIRSDNDSPAQLASVSMVTLTLAMEGPLGTQKKQSSLVVRVNAFAGGFTSSGVFVPT